MVGVGGGRVPPAARVLPSKVFYGWYIAVACSCFLFVGVGVGYYGLAVFLRPLQEAHGWSNGAVSGATGLYFTLSGVTGALVGPRIDRHGPLRFMLVGSVLTGLAVGLVGFVDELWQLYAVYSLLAVAFGLSTAVSVNSILARWFVGLRARAMSIAYTGVSVGGVVLVPVGTRLIEVGGLELAAPLMGLLVLAVAVPVLLLVLAWNPEELGLEPDGGAAPAAGSTVDQAAQRRTWTRQQVIRTVPFWALLVAFVVVLAAQTGVIIHQISFLEDRLGSRSAAAFALSVTAGGSIVARLVVGRFADRIDKRWLTVGLFVLQATAVLGVLRTDSVALTYVLTVIFGFTIGNTYIMQSLLVAEIFGVVSFGTVFGLVSLASQASSGLGPFLVGWLEDRTGGYDLPLTVAALVTIAASLLVLLARPIREEVPAAAGPELAEPVATGL